MIMPLAQLIMAQVAGPQRMGRVMGIVSMPAMLAPILGPVVGGVILQNLHWSWIFFVNAPIGAVAMYLGWRMLPETDSGEAGPLDRLGLALLPAGAALTIFGISKLGSGGSLSSPEVLGPLIAGILLSVAFCLHALRIPRPLLDVRLYKNKVFAGASFTTFGLGAALFGAMILVPLYYQSVRHLSVIDTGLLNGPQGIGALIMMPIAGRLTERYGGGRIAIIGVSLLALSTIPLAFIGANTSYRRDLGRAVRPRDQHRPRLHAGDDRRLRGDAPGAALRRDAPDQRGDAARQRRRRRDPRRRAPARLGRRPHFRPARRRVRAHLLVGLRDRAALADPVPGAAESRAPERHRGGRGRARGAESLLRHESAMEVGI